MNRPSRHTKTALNLLILVLLMSSLTWLLPVPSTWAHTPTLFHISLFDATLYALLHIAAGVLFLLGGRAYKARLRLAYLIMISSVVLGSLGLAQFAVLQAFDLMQSSWITSGAAITPFLLSGFIAYTGTRWLARQVGITSWLGRFTVLLPSIALFVLFVSVLPHPPDTVPEVAYDLSKGLTATNLVIYAFCLGLTLQMVQHMGAYYKQAMAWLSLSFLATVAITVASMFIPIEIKEPLLWLDAMLISAGFIYLKAGHAFAKTEEL